MQLYYHRHVSFKKYAYLYLPEIFTHAADSIPILKNKANIADLIIGAPLIQVSGFAFAKSKDLINYRSQIMITKQYSCIKYGNRTLSQQY